MKADRGVIGFVWYIAGDNNRIGDGFIFHIQNDVDRIIYDNNHRRIYFECCI